MYPGAGEEAARFQQAIAAETERHAGGSATADTRFRARQRIAEKLERLRRGEHLE